MVKLLDDISLFETEERDRRLGDWIDAFAKHTERSESPLEFRIWCAIAGISAALQRKVWVRCSEFTWYPNLYIVLAAPPGVARKSSTLGKIKELVRECETVKLASDSTTAESFIEQISEATSSLIYTDSRGEDVMKEHHSVSIFASELGSFIRPNDQNMMNYLTDLFDSPDSWEYKTKHAARKSAKKWGNTDNLITNCFVSLLGATTPSWLSSPHVQDGLEHGWARRCLFVYAEEKGQEIPNPWVHKPDNSMKEDLIYDLQTIHKIAGEMEMTEQAQKLYSDFYQKEQRLRKKEAFPFPLTKEFEGYISTRMTHVTKIAMICAVSRSFGLSVEGQDFERAIAILESVEEKMAVALQGNGDSRVKDAVNVVLSYVKAKGETTRAAMLANIYDRVDPYMLDQVERVLEGMDEVKMIIRGSDRVFKWVRQADASNDKIIKLNDTS